MLNVKTFASERPNWISLESLSKDECGILETLRQQLPQLDRAHGTRTTDSMYEIAARVGRCNETGYDGGCVLARSIDSSIQTMFLFDTNGWQLMSLGAASIDSSTDIQYVPINGFYPMHFDSRAIFQRISYVVMPTDLRKFSWRSIVETEPSVVMAKSLATWLVGAIDTVNPIYLNQLLSISKGRFLPLASLLEIPRGCCTIDPNGNSVEGDGFQLLQGYLDGGEQFCIALILERENCPVVVIDSGGRIFVGYGAKRCRGDLHVHSFEIPRASFGPPKRYGKRLLLERPRLLPSILPNEIGVSQWSEVAYSRVRSYFRVIG